MAALPSSIPPADKSYYSIKPGIVESVSINQVIEAIKGIEHTPFAWPSGDPRRDQDLSLEQRQLVLASLMKGIETLKISLEGTSYEVLGGTLGQSGEVLENVQYDPEKVTKLKLTNFLYSFWNDFWNPPK